MATDRPRSLTLGVALLVLLSLFSFVPFPIPEGEEGPPAFIIWGSVVLGIVGLVAAVGLWQRRRWGWYLALAVLVLGILSAAPGIPFAPNLLLRLAAFVSVVVGVLAVVLLLRPASRAALAA